METKSRCKVCGHEFRVRAPVGGWSLRGGPSAPRGAQPVTALAIRQVPSLSQAA